MAVNINGGTDTIRYTTGGLGSTGTIAFRMKTSSITTNVAVVTVWSNTSRAGIGFILNLTGNANKIAMQCFDATAARVSFATAATMNDGNWHSLGFNWNTALGQTNTLYIDGASDSSGNTTGSSWSILSNPVSIGDNNDTFWASYVGDVCDVGIWNSRQLTADEHAAYGKGVSPKMLSPNGLVRFMPLCRTTNDTRSGTAATVTGTTFSDHPRVTGGAV